jgi:hypothetical protein
LNYFNRNQFDLNNKLFGRTVLMDYVMKQYNVTIYSDHQYIPEDSHIVPKHVAEFTWRHGLSGHSTNNLWHTEDCILCVCVCVCVRAREFVCKVFLLFYLAKCLVSKELHHLNDNWTSDEYLGKFEKKNTSVDIRWNFRVHIAPIKRAIK